MMEPITLTVLGDPKGQPRPKAFSRGGHARVYDPGTAEGWKSQIAVAAKESGAVGLMLDTPLKVEIHAYFKRPKSHYRSGKNSKMLKEAAPAFHTGKPDFDNLGKAACDALTHLGVWGDDAQIVDGKVTKRYSIGAARTIITITEATEAL
jgi:Holliday junction resolvase RusA-like endonuclease